MNLKKIVLFEKLHLHRILLKTVPIEVCRNDFEKNEKSKKILYERRYLQNTILKIVSTRYIGMIIKKSEVKGYKNLLSLKDGFYKKSLRKTISIGVHRNDFKKALNLKKSFFE